jgi:hypothetical protein
MVVNWLRRRHHFFETRFCGVYVHGRQAMPQVNRILIWALSKNQIDNFYGCIEKIYNNTIDNIYRAYRKNKYPITSD